MAKKKKNNIFSILGYVFIVLLLIGVIGFIGVYTNGFTGNISTFYVTYKGEKITDKKDLTFVLGTKNRFDVKYSFDFLPNQDSDYSVKIIPNTKNDFDITVDGGYKQFISIDDYTSVFDIDVQKDYFTISFNDDMSMESILELAYDGKDVEILSAVDMFAKDYFTIIVTAGKVSVSINFKFHFIITLDKDGIIF